jgi:hypothetical protein
MRIAGFDAEIPNHEVLEHQPKAIEKLVLPRALMNFPERN